METMRNGVFETNSSSEHCFTIGDGFRDRSEFPVPDEYGNVHIPWCRFDDLNSLETFTELAQLLILFVVEAHTGYIGDLFRIDKEKRLQLVNSILIAYKMAGISGADGVVIDFPKPVTGLELDDDGNIELNNIFNWTEVNLMSCSIDGGIQNMRAKFFLKNNNVASVLVDSMLSKCSDEDVLYTAALLAMNVKGKIVEC